MIQELYLKEAINIRKEYISLMKDVEGYKVFSNNMTNFIQNKTDELKSLQEKINLGQEKNVELAKNKVLKVITDFESEAKKLDVIITKFNGEMEKLKESELSLYRNIKQTYPELTDDTIRKEIYDYLVENNIK